MHAKRVQRAGGVCWAGCGRAAPSIPVIICTTAPHRIGADSALQCRQVTTMRARWAACCCVSWRAARPRRSQGRLRPRCRPLFWRRVTRARTWQPHGRICGGKVHRCRRSTAVCRRHRAAHCARCAGAQSFTALSAFLSEMWLCSGRGTLQRRLTAFLFDLCRQQLQE